MARIISLRSVRLLPLVLPLWCSSTAVADAVRHAHSPLVRPALLETDLPRLMRFLELDDAQEAAARILLWDQLEADERSISVLRSVLRKLDPDRDDHLEAMRAGWGEVWDRDTHPINTTDGQAEVRAIAEAYLNKVDQLALVPSSASTVLTQFARTAAAQRGQVIEGLAVLLDTRQQARLQTADSAAALARSAWPPVLAQERLDLDALLVDTLLEQATTAQWMALRAQWLRAVGQSIVERDRLLAQLEPSLIDAELRTQPGLSLLLQRRAMAARLAHAATLDGVRTEMSEALAEVGLVNTFQRQAHRRMYPELYGVDRADRQFLAALSLPDLDGDSYSAVEAAQTRHRSRKFVVQSHLTAQSAVVARRRLLRGLETTLIRQLFGTGAGMLGLDPALDASVAETAGLQKHLRDARMLAEAELKVALPDDVWAEVHNRAQQSATTARNRMVQAAQGKGVISLPLSESFGDAPKP